MDDKELNYNKKIEELQESNINLRFNAVEKELLEIKMLLKDSIFKADKNHELALENIDNLKNRILILEEKDRNSPIQDIVKDVDKYYKETSFIRSLFKNPWKGVILTTIWIIIIAVLTILFGPKELIEAVMKLKGL